MNASLHSVLCDALERTTKGAKLGALRRVDGRLNDERVRALAARLQQAIDAHHKAQKRHAAARRSGYDAKLFARECRKQLEAVIQLLDSRFASHGGVVTIGTNADTHFALWARADLYPVLKTWRDRAQVEAEAAVPATHLPDTARRRLEAAVADCLQACGARPTSASTGLFARILRDVVYPRVGVNSGTNQLGPTLAWWRQTRRTQIQAAAVDQPPRRQPRTIPP